MSLILAAVMGWFRTNPRNIWLIGGLLAVVLVLTFVYMRGRHDAHARDEARQKIAVTAAVKSDDRADVKATTALARDAILIDAKQKRLEDAVANVPDQVPDAVAVAAGCVELQSHGISTADLPACKPARR
jgi:hypothetical protein